MLSEGPTTPVVLLVPGLWHGAWAWSKIETLLDARGIAHRSITFPGHDRQDGDPTFAGHCAYLRAQVEAIPGPVFVVAHSYAGAVVTQAADPSRVAGMLFVAAFPLQLNESIADVVDGRAGGPDAVADAEIRMRDGSLTVDRGTALSGFYQDCDPVEAAAAFARLTPEHPSTRSTRVTVASWRSIPSHYVVCTDDRALTVGVQRALASRLGSSSDIASGHCPMISRAEELTEAIAAGVRWKSAPV